MSANAGTTWSDFAPIIRSTASATTETLTGQDGRASLQVSRARACVKRERLQPMGREHGD